MEEKMIFTANYAYGAQLAFKTELAQNKYEEAYKILKNILPALTDEDNVQRNKMIIEGLNVLVNELLLEGYQEKLIGDEKAELKNEMNEMEEEYKTEIRELREEYQDGIRKLKSELKSNTGKSISKNTEQTKNQKLHSLDNVVL